MIQHEIKNYQHSDQEDVIEFFRAVLAEMGFDFDLTARHKDLTHITNEYQANGGLFLLATHERRLIGTLALRQIAEDTCELKRFFVQREFHRKGVGAALLKRAIDHAKAGPWSRLRLDTSHKSPAAIALFTKHGFVEIERYNEDPFAEIFMELATA
jgi:GNAT superfamily N-acetyltransferase